MEQVTTWKSKKFAAYASGTVTISAARGSCLVAVIAALSLWISLCGCHQTRGFSNTVSTTGTFAAGKLLTGFYPPENQDWRWVARQFSVALEPPRALTHNGALLTVHLFLPETEIQAVGPITLNAMIDGRSIGSQTFTKAGSFDFTRELPFEVVDTNILPIRFCFDKSIPPISDKRELAAVISGITLVARQNQ